MMYTAKGQLDRDALIRQHVPLVRRIAHHMIAKLPPNVELDDLIQVGMMGLAEALSRYETATSCARATGCRAVRAKARKTSNKLCTVWSKNWGAARSNQKSLQRWN